MSVFSALITCEVNGWIMNSSRDAEAPLLFSAPTYMMLLAYLSGLAHFLYKQCENLRIDLTIIK